MNENWGLNWIEVSKSQIEYCYIWLGIIRAISCYGHYIQKPIFWKLISLTNLFCSVFFSIHNLYHHSLQGIWLSAEKKLSFLQQRHQYFCFELLPTLQKKQPTVLCVHLTLFSLWIDPSDKYHLLITGTKLRLRVLKSSYIPYCVVRFWARGKTCCCGHYTVFVTDILYETFFLHQEE